MKDNNIFGRALGGSASKNDYALLVVHGLSVILTVFGVYAAWDEYMEALSVTGKIKWAFAIVAAIAIQVVILAKEGGVARILVWWAFPSVGAIFLFLIDALVLGGGIWANHQISQTGRIYIVDKIVADPVYQEDTTLLLTKEAGLAPIVSKFVADSLEVVNAERSAKRANRAAEKAIKVKIGPGDYRSPADALAKAKAVKAASPSWHDGILQNRKTAMDEARLARLAADAEAERIAAEQLAALVERRKQQEQPVVDKWIAQATQHRIKEEARVNRRKDSKDLLMDAGKWLVIITAFGSFALRLSHETYRRVAGLELIGEVHDPERNGESIAKEVKKAIEARKRVTAERIAASTQEYVTAATAKGAYRMPPGRYLVGSFMVSLLAFSFTQISFFSFSEQAQMMIVPAPMNYVLFFVSIVLFGSFAFHEAKKGKAIKLTDQRGKVSVELKDDDNSQQVSQQSAVVSQGADRDSQGADLDADNNAEHRMADESQQSVLQSSIDPPPPMLADPGKSGRLSDDWIKYRKRVYGWWKTAHNPKKPESTRQENMNRCKQSFPLFEAQGCKVVIRGAKLSILTA